MNVPTLLIGVSIVAIFWRVRAASTRSNLLLVGTLIGSLLLTWLAIANADQSPLISIGLFTFDVTLIAFTLWAIGQRHFKLALIVLIGLFVVLKWPGLIETTSITWLGASYLLFRLLHLILESRKGQLPSLDFKATLIYALFPPTLIAGPIDRLPRFQTDLAQIDQPFRSDFVANGAWRIFVGAFKKFVLADFLAHLPLKALDQLNGNGSCAIIRLMCLCEVSNVDERNSVS